MMSIRYKDLLLLVQKTSHTSNCQKKRRKQTVQAILEYLIVYPRQDKEGAENGGEMKQQ